MSHRLEKKQAVILCIVAIFFSVLAAKCTSELGGRFIQQKFEDRKTCDITAESEVLDGNMVVSQSLKLPYKRLNKLSISIAHLDPEAEIERDAVLRVSIRNDESILYTWTTVPLSELIYDEDSFGVLKPQAIYTFEVPDEVTIGEGDYLIDVSGENLHTGSQIGLGAGGENIYVETEGELIQHPEERELFCFLYIFAFVLILLRMILCRDILKKEKFDTVIIGYILFLFTFTFTYYEDSIMIYENARVMKSAIKRGEFLHYYDYAFVQSRYRLNANYNVILYIIFAICLLPYDLMCKIAGDIPLYYGHIWYNAVVCGVFVFTAYQLRRLLTVWGIKDDVKNIITVLYYLNPILLFCTVGFSQLDIFYIAVFLEGLILFEKGKTDHACLVWSVSIAMKTFPVLIVIPLILMREKRIVHILRYLSEAAGLTVLCHLIYGNSEGWIQNQLHSDHYSRIFSSMIPSQVGSISLFLVFYLMIVFYCWTTGKKESYKTTIMCGLAVYMAFFVFTSWNPQYAAMTGLFLAMAVLVAEKPFVFLALEAFFALGYIVAVWMHFGDVNNVMVLTGIIGGFRYVNETPLSFSEVMAGIAGNAYVKEFALSISAAAGVSLLLYCLYCIRKERKNNWVFPAGYLYLPVMPVLAILLFSGIISFSS